MEISYHLLKWKKNNYRELIITKKCDVADLWDDLYKNHLDVLPWVSNPKPTKVLDSFLSELTDRDAILDYGAGDGVFINFLSKNFKEITFAEISKEALQLCKSKSFMFDRRFNFVLTDFPYKELFNNKKFDGIIVWGVFHHIKKENWTDFLKAFYNILSYNGTILVGAHSRRDSEFQNKRTTYSRYTKLKRYPIDPDFKTMAKRIGFNISNEGKFPFVEKVTGKNRDFNYYFLQKDEYEP